MTTRIAVLALVAAGCSEFDLRNNSDADVGPAPDILVDPPSLEYGTLSTGETEVQTFTVQNVGDSVLNVSDVVIGSGIAFTVLGPETKFDLEPGESTTVDVQFTPMGADENFGQALVMSDDPDSPETPVDLLGFGAVPELEITPGSYVFGDAFVPCGATVDLQMKNVGTEDLVITDWTYTSGGLLVLDDAAARAQLPITLHPDETGSVTVEFLPATAGSDTGTIAVTSNDPRGVVKATQNGEGSYIDTNTETFTEPGVPPVDVMLLIDHSCSMEGDNVDDIENGIPGFVTELLNVSDFHLIEVTKDNGCANGGVMDNTTANISDLLIQHAWDAQGGGLLGTYLTEALLELADIALQDTAPGGCNDGFLRPGALLDIITISDEHEQSGSSGAHWVAEYQTYVASPDFVKVSGVHDINTNCGDGTGDGGYVDAINQTGGIELNICNSNWGAGLTDLATDVADGSRSYNLSDEPDPASVTVTVNGVAATDISVAGANVTVNDPPVGEGDVVEITYGVLAECN